MFHRIGSIKAYIVFSEVGQTKINNEDTFQLSGMFYQYSCHTFDKIMKRHF